MSLSDADFEFCRSRKPLYASKDDTQWPLIRSVISVLCTAACCNRALYLAIILVNVTRETKDIDLLKAAYLGVSAQERRQTRLLTQLRPLWPRYGGLLQAVIDAGAQQDGLRTQARGCFIGGEVLDRMDLVDGDIGEDLGFDYRLGTHYQHSS